MRILHFILVLAFVSGTAHAQQTAYQALRTLAEQKDRTYLQRVIEIRGDQGVPQPLIWKITIDDPSARGGVREFEMSGGRILSERAPVRILGGSGPRYVVSLKNLNLDSDGVFRIVNAVAKKEYVGFDSANYLLRADDSSGTSVWNVNLVDYTGTMVGTIAVAGASGTVVHTANMTRRNAANPNTFSGTMTEPADGGFAGRAGRTLNKAGESVRKGTLRTYDTVKGWFGGSTSQSGQNPAQSSTD